MKDESRFASLSRREKEVVASLLQGKSNKQIALSLGISERTVEFHLRNIYAKLQVASRVELILKLGTTAGNISENPVESTVVRDDKKIDNGNRPVQQRRWVRSLRNTVSLIHQEIAMTIRIVLEDLEHSLRNRPLLFSLILFLTVSLTVRYALITLGLYFWFSYVLLGVLLGLGSAYWGASLRRFNTGETYSHPLIFMGIVAILPLTVAVLDEVFLLTVAKSMRQIAITIVDISNTAVWLVSPEGHIYLHTTRSIISDDLWLFTMISMLLLFIFGVVSNKWFRRKDLAPS